MTVLNHLVLDSISAFRLCPKMHLRPAALCRSLNNSVWFWFDCNVQHYFVSIRKTFIDIYVALTELQKKKFLHTLYHTKNTQNFIFAWKSHTKFSLHNKNKAKFLFARGLSIRQLPALGCWNVTLLQLLLLQKKLNIAEYVVLPSSDRMSRW